MFKKNHPNYIDDSQSITYIYIYVYIYILAISDDRLLELGVLVSRFHDTSITNPHRNPPALPACLVKWGLMTDCLSVLCFCLYSLS